MLDDKAIPTPAQAAHPGAPRPVRGRDVTNLRMLLGLRARDVRFLLGFPKASESNSGAHPEGDPASPYVGILVRMLMEHPEDNPLPPMPDFNDIRKLFAQSFPHGRDGLAMQHHVAIYLGTRKSSGSDWNAARKTPSPPIRRLFWMLQHMVELYGEKEAFLRWKSAVEGEAAARGVTLEDVFEAGTWPRVEGEATRGSKSSEDADDGDAE